MNKFVDNDRQDEEHEYSPNNDTNRDNRSIKVVNQSPNAKTNDCYTTTPYDKQQKIAKPFCVEVLVIIVFTFLYQVV